MKKTLVGLFNAASNLSDVKQVVESLDLKPGTKVGVEYSFHDFYGLSDHVEDIFWRKVINYLQKEKKCKIVFLDSEQLRTESSSRRRKEGKLTLRTAKLMYDKREKVFLKGIPECEVSFLGAEHAIRLQKKTKARVVLDSVSFAMDKFNLLALTPQQQIKGLKLRKRREKFFRELKEHGSLHNLMVAKGLIKPKKMSAKKKPPKKPARNRRV